MRLFWTIALLWLACPLWAGPDQIPAPPPLEWSVADSLPRGPMVAAAWTVALGSGGVSLVLTGWGLGTALSDLDSPGGPPLGATFSTLAWSTVLMALAGVALDFALTDPAPARRTAPDARSSRRCPRPRRETGDGFLRRLRH